MEADAFLSAADHYRARQQLMSVAMKHAEQGDLAAARAVILEIRERGSQTDFRPDYWLAVMALQDNDAEEALACAERAIAIMPRFAPAFSCRGMALESLGNISEAIESFRKAVELDPNFVDGHGRLGKILLRGGQLELAMACFDEVVRLQPTKPSGYYNRGVVLVRMKRFLEAVDSLDEAIRTGPEFVEAYINRGNALVEVGRAAAAIEDFNRAIELNRDHAETYYNRGNAFIIDRQFDAAITDFDTAIALNPRLAAAYSSRGLAQSQLRRMDEAIENFDRALAIEGDLVHAHIGRGDAYLGLNQPSAAANCYDEAISRAPETAKAYLNKAMTLLLRGDLVQGFELYEWRWKALEKDVPRREFDQPRWLGTQPLAGKTIFLHSEQGLGDVIQFCRYATVLADRGANVILEAPAELVALLRTLRGVTSLVTKGQPLPTFDFYSPLLSVPFAVQTDWDSLPCSRSYLSADPEKRARWEVELGPHDMPRIGLVWRGNPKHPRDLERSLPLAKLLPALPTGYELISLQLGLNSEDQSALLEFPGFRHFGSELSDFSETAALLDCVDLVIAVDTAVAHLGGALGKPVFLLLPHSPDWRWLLNRSDSPWYPSLQLFRQSRADDWGAVLKSLRAHLHGQFPHHFWTRASMS
jgi:hypothetical protein